MMSNLNKICGIYKVTSPTERVYIGQAKNIKARWRDYYGMYSLVKGQVKLYRSFIKYGVASHTFEILEVCEIEKLNERERYWQDFYDVLNGGLNCILQQALEKRRVFSKDTLKKMSHAQKGVKSHLYGKKLSEKTRRKMSERQIGEKNLMFGRCGELHHNYKKELSLETKIKMAEGTRRVNRGLVTGFASKPIIDIETGVFYNSITDAVKYHGTSYSHLVKMIDGIKPNKTNLRRC